MALERFRLDDRAALVTGAGRGIGAACARVLAEAGADVVLTARSADQLEAVAADVRALGRRAVVIPADANDLEALTAVVAEGAEELGRLDVVVNNVGGTMPRQIMDTSPGYLERAFHFNVTTAFAVTKAAVPHLLASAGEGSTGIASVINISSAIGRLRDRGMVAYGTAKAALTHMTRLTAADLAPRIRVNAVAVGSTATSALDIVLESPDMHAEMVAGTPLRRLGDPEDIAMGVLYLASPASSWVTGKVLEVDGGLEEPNLAMNLPDL